MTRQPDHPGRRARFDRSDPEGTRQAPAPGSADQDLAGIGRWDHRGRRHAGLGLRGGHHRVQCDPRRSGPLAGRRAECGNPALRHHLQGDDDIRAMLEGKLKPEERVIELGQALVKQVFSYQSRGRDCRLLRGAGDRSNEVVASVSIATAVRSATTIWIRSGAKRKTSRRSHAAWSAASSCPASTM